MGIKDVSMEFKNSRADEGVGSNSGRTVHNYGIRVIRV